MIRINNNTENKGNGYVAYQKLMNSKKQETIEIIFTKGKLIVEMDKVDRINMYSDGMNIFYKDGASIFINLDNATQIL